MEKSSEDIVRHYKSLSPNCSIKNGRSSLSALKWAIKQNNIHNIALTGNYGSGKSSVIQTLLNEDKDLKKNTITISLANFADIENTDSNELQKLEKGILKQIFYKVDTNTIPNSKFKKIKISDVKKDAWYLIQILFVCIFLYLLSQDVNTFFSRIKNRIVKFSGLEVILFVVSGIVTIYCVYFLYTYFIRNLNIHSIHFRNNSFEIDSSKNESIFDKYLDEIVYFFEENQNYKTVIFEDLDRFNNLDIFVRLKELNQILNNDDSIKDNKITFIYAVRDDLFKGTERTKFFDFIIPVTPIINRFNAEEDLLQIMHTDNKYAISDDCVFTVGLYITEMRLLYNICNEYYMFLGNKPQFENLDLKYDNLFSLIVFKNLEPDKFAAVQDGNGILQKVFVVKNNFIENKIKSIEELKNKETIKLNKYNNDRLQSKKELKKVFLTELLHNNELLFIRGSRLDSDITYDEIMKADFDLQTLLFSKTGSLTVYFYSRRGNNNHYYSKGIDDIVQPYIDRINYLDEKNKKKQEQICKEYENEYKTISRLRQYSLKSLIDKYTFDEIFENADFEFSGLLRMLLIHGYIDENFDNYINYFKGISISANDYKFILSIKEDKHLGWQYPLNNSISVIEALHEIDFKRQAIFNYDLLNTLLSSEGYSNYLNIIIDTLCENINNSDFITEYLRVCIDLSQFVPLLFNKWKNAVEYIYNSNLLDSVKTQYFIYMVDYLNINQFNELENKHLISKFIISDPNFLRDVFSSSLYRSKKNIKIWKKVLLDLNVKFQALNIDGLDPSLLVFIFNNNLYELNLEMIRIIVGYKNKSLLKDMNKHVYSTIKKLGYKELKDYIDSDIKLFVVNVFINKENKDEGIVNIVEVISKCLKLGDDTYKLIFENMDFEMFFEHHLYHIECSDQIMLHDIWDCALENNKVRVRFRNLYDYWKQYGYTDVLAHFIKENIETLIEPDGEIGSIFEDFKYDFYNAYNLDFYINMSKYIGFRSTVDFDRLNDSIIEFLIKNNLVTISPKNFEELNKLRSDLIPQFIMNSEDIFERNINDFTVEDNLYSNLINNKQISFNVKYALIESKDGLYVDENLAKTLYLSMDKNSFRPKIYKYIIEALEKEENFQIQILMTYLEQLDGNLLMYSFEYISRYQIISNCIGEKISINRSKRNLMIVERMKILNLIDDYTITSKLIIFIVNKNGELNE